MKIVLSPAKTLDFEQNAPTSSKTQPQFQEEVQELVGILQQYSEQDLAELMNVNNDLAHLNYQRYQSFEQSFTPNNAKEALFAFKGDVYDGLDAATLSEEDIDFAQKHVRILSGLYGILRPLDLMQPYRLEMSTKLQNPKGNNLYDYWGQKITDKLNEEMQQDGDEFLLNLASKEYFKAIQPKALNVPVISPAFKEAKGGQYKVIALYAKKARGLMTRFVIRNRISSQEGIKSFQEDGYAYNDKLSTEKEPVFTRD